MYRFCGKMDTSFHAAFFFSAGKTFWDQRVGVRIRVVVLNTSTNETHGFAKMGGGEPDEKERRLLSPLCSALRLYRINEILLSIHGGP